MYAVVETDGRQYQVIEGKYIDVELINEEPEKNITFDKIVAVIAGEKSQIGQPYIEGATVSAKILDHGKTKKVIAYKMHRKKGYRVKKGHRQNFTRVLIENIEFPNKEETLSYVKEIEEKLAQELQAKEEKLQEAIDKRNEAKEAKKKTKAEKPKKEVKAEVEEIKEEVKPAEEAEVEQEAPAEEEKTEE